MKRFLKSLCAIGLLAVLPGWVPGAESAAPGWVALAGRPEPTAEVPPLAYWSETWTTPRPVRFHFLRLDLRHPGYEVCALVAPDLDGEGPAEATLRSPLRLAEDGAVVAAVNANAFSHLATADQAERARGWFEGKRVEIAGLAVVDGIGRSRPDQVLASVWTDAGGRLFIGLPERLDGARQGISSWIDRLLTAGEVVARPDGQLHPRTFIGSDAERRVLLLAVADGRQKGYSEGLSLAEAAQVMKEHGCHEATNLDGGGSSIMLAQAPDAAPGKMVILNRPSGGSPRPIPVMLGVRRRVLAPP
jgi:hypothetical protein